MNFMDVGSFIANTLCPPRGRGGPGSGPSWGWGEEHFGKEGQESSSRTHLSQPSSHLESSEGFGSSSPTIFFRDDEAPVQRDGI